jgi:flagellar biogenesis protein FliO
VSNKARMYVSRFYLGIAISSLCILVSGIVQAKPSGAEVHTKDPGVEGSSKVFSTRLESSESFTFITVQLSKAPEYTNLELRAVDNILEVRVPGEQSEQVGVFEDVETKFIKKVAMFQEEPNLIAIRYITEKPAEHVLAGIHQERNYDKFLLKVNHRLVEESLAKDPSQAVTVAQQETLQGVLDSSSEISLASMVEDASPVLEWSYSGMDMRKRAVLVVMFLGFLCFVLLLVKYFKSGRSLRFMFRTRSASIISPLKLLGSHSVSNRHKINLFEIEGEKILLAVTPEGIQYLTKIEKREPIPPAVSLPHQSVYQAPSSAFEKQLIAADPIESPAAAGPIDTRQALKSYKKVGRDKKSTMDASEVITDVRKLIRQKLQNLPPV